MHQWLAFGKREGRVHQRKMTERLREIAELPPAFRVILFSQQAKIVAGGSGSFEYSAGICLPAYHLINAGEPE